MNSKVVLNTLTVFGLLHDVVSHFPLSYQLPYVQNMLMGGNQYQSNYGTNFNMIPESRCGENGLICELPPAPQGYLPYPFVVIVSKPSSINENNFKKSEKIILRDETTTTEEATTPKSSEDPTTPESTEPTTIEATGTTTTEATELITSTEATEPTTTEATEPPTTEATKPTPPEETTVKKKLTRPTAKQYYHEKMRDCDSLPDCIPRKIYEKYYGRNKNYAYKDPEDKRRQKIYEDSVLNDDLRRTGHTIRRTLFGDNEVRIRPTIPLRRKTKNSNEKRWLPKFGLVQLPDHIAEKIVTQYKGNDVELFPI